MFFVYGKTLENSIRFIGQLVSHMEFAFVFQPKNNKDIKRNGE